MKEQLVTPIDQLRQYLDRYHSVTLSDRVLAALRTIGIRHIEDLEGFSRKRLLDQPGFGQVSLKTLEMALSRFNISIQPKPAEAYRLRQRARYKANKEREHMVVRCIPAHHMRVLSETCEGFLDDHRSCMVDTDIRNLLAAIRSAKYALSRPLPKEQG